MTRSTRWLRDVIVAAVITLGIVGMHHLVIVACHHTPSSPVASPFVGAADSHHQAPEPLTPPHEPSGDLAAVCLAILAMAGALLVGASVVIGRVRIAACSWTLRTWFERALPPPDLAMLSISRT